MTETTTGPGEGVTTPPVRAALATWAERKDARTFADVLRRALAGSLLLDATDSIFADPAAAALDRIARIALAGD